MVDADELVKICRKGWKLFGFSDEKICHWVDEYDINAQPTINAIPVEQLLSILPRYDDYIHTKTYPYNETMEDIYSKGHEEGWNACLKAIKEELEDWEKEND